VLGYEVQTVCSVLFVGVRDHAESQPATHVTNEHDAGQQAALAARYSRLMYRRWVNAVFPAQSLDVSPLR
jgi:hypothetical protein